MFGLAFEDVASHAGVVVRGSGEGEPIVVVPGMEGSGESCMQVVAAVQREMDQRRRPRRILLVDFARETHPTLEALCRAAGELIAPCVAVGRWTLWAQSFGNLVALGALSRIANPPRSALLVSAFQSLPVWSPPIAIVAAKFTPPPLYAKTVKPLGRYIFGPAGDQPNHPFFDALARMPTAAFRRRTSWLMGRRFDDLFRRLPAQTDAFLGERDRLVDLPVQAAFLGSLALSGTLRFAMVPGAGHVALPTATVELVTAAVAARLTSQNGA